MMAQPVNLNRYRKQKAQVTAKARAEQNATLSGRTKSQKGKDCAAADKARRALDGHKTEP